MNPHLILRFDAPLISTGGVAVDNIGVCDSWPSTSLLVGLFANALGWRRVDGSALQRLQARLQFACRLDRCGQPLLDFQTAQLHKNDRGWTTGGVVQGRAGGVSTYDSPHLRYRHYWADRVLTLVCTLEPADEHPTVQDLQDALGSPARPLFIGRKTCLPGGAVLLGAEPGESCMQVLHTVPVPACGDAGPFPAMTTQLSAVDAGGVAQQAAGFRQPPEQMSVCGRKNWFSGAHGGQQYFLQGSMDMPGPDQRGGPIPG